MTEPPGGFFHYSQIEARCHLYWFDMYKSDNITFYSQNGWIFKVIQAVSVVIWMESELISPVCDAWLHNRNFVTLQIFQPRTAQLGKIDCQAVLLLVETCVERHISVILLCARPLEWNQMVSTLESKDIFCLHSKHIPLCGGVDIVAFDKVSPTF